MAQCKAAADNGVAFNTSGNVSYGNTLNPVSQAFGGGDKYPKWWRNLFSNPEVAAMTFKMGAIGTLAFLTSAAVRGVAHNNAASATYDDPSAGLKSHIGTSFVSPLAPTPTRKERRAAKKQEKAKNKETQSKEAAETGSYADRVELPAATDVTKNVERVALPLAALVLGTAGGWKIADMLSDRIRNRQLTKEIKNKSNIVRKLMQTRARLAKGTATDNELYTAETAAKNPDDSLVKMAKDPHPVGRNLLTGYGLMVLALGLASSIGSYKYFSASDPNNIKFKALKQGLQTYAKEKTAITPITTVPSDAAEYFAAIDEGGKDKNVREEPEKQAVNRGVAISD